MALRLSLVWLVLIGLLALGGPFVAARAAAAVHPADSLGPPSAAHLLGTDLLGRDVLARLLAGATRTLGMAFAAVVVSAAPGTLLGLTAGYWGEGWDAWLGRALDAALAVPQLLIALLVTAALGSGPWAVGLAVGLAGVAGFARLARGAVQQIRGQLYIQSAQALGAGPLEIMLRHVLRNALPALAAFATIHFAWALLNTSALTFLGFGGDPATPDWGLMLNEGRAYWSTAPWVSAAPGLALTLTVLAVNTVGARWGEGRGRGEAHASA
jgi:peptide/nickel transport system permease protein